MKLPEHINKSNEIHYVKKFIKTKYSYVFVMHNDIYQIIFKDKEEIHILPGK